MLLVQKAGFLGLLKRHPELALRMLGSMSSHLRVLVGQLEDLMMKDVETRLANWLLKRCPDPDGAAPVNIDLPMTKRVLASELGTVSETFSRTLAKFREQKLISVKGRVVTVLCPAKLARCCGATWAPERGSTAIELSGDTGGRGKSEIRDPRSERNPKPEIRRGKQRLRAGVGRPLLAASFVSEPKSSAQARHDFTTVRISDFGFLSDLGLRISDLNLPSGFPYF